MRRYCAKYSTKWFWIRNSLAFVNASSGLGVGINQTINNSKNNGYKKARTFAGLIRVNV
jgi:hypothetical protein